MYPLYCFSLKLATWVAETCRRYTKGIIHSHRLVCICWFWYHTQLFNATVTNHLTLINAPPSTSLITLLSSLLQRLRNAEKITTKNGAYGSLRWLLLRSVSRPNVKWVRMTTRCWGQYLVKRRRTKKCLEEITQGRAAQISYQILVRVRTVKVQEHQSYNTHAHTNKREILQHVIWNTCQGRPF